MTRLAEALREQAGACAALGSPFMQRLMLLLADRLKPDRALTRRLFDWPGDLSPWGDSVPLRLAGALHALVLSGRAPDLAAAYPPNRGDDGALWAAVDAALTEQAAFIDAMLDSPPQTNEIRRSACLIAAAHRLAHDHDLPLVLSEIGASGGLNLNWDRYGLDVGQGRVLGPPDPALVLTPDWSGPAPPPTRPRVAERRGVDLRPIDAGSPEGQLRLLAYLWPDQPERLARTRAALALPHAPVDRGDALDWLAARLERPRAGHLHMIYSTIAWQYLPADRRARGASLIETAGRAATPEAPLAWFTMEADGARPGAALTLRQWPGDLRLDLGRAGFHGEWVDWHRIPKGAT